MSLCHLTAIVNSMFAVQVPLPSDVRETDFFRFVARNLKGAKDVEIEHASYNLRIGYVFFSSRKECESAAQVFQGNELNGVTLEPFVIHPEPDTPGLLVERKQPEETEETAKKHTRHKHRHRHRRQSERGKSDGAESGRHKSRHRHRHHHRRRRDSYSDDSSYSSESSESSSGDYSSEESDSSRSSSRHRHKHRHHSRSSTPAK